MADDPRTVEERIEARKRELLRNQQRALRGEAVEGPSSGDWLKDAARAIKDGYAVDLTAPRDVFEQDPEAYQAAPPAGAPAYVKDEQGATTTVSDKPLAVTSISNQMVPRKDVFEDPFATADGKSIIVPNKVAELAATWTDHLFQKERTDRNDPEAVADVKKRALEYAQAKAGEAALVPSENLTGIRDPAAQREQAREGTTGAGGYLGSFLTAYNTFNDMGARALFGKGFSDLRDDKATELRNYLGNVMGVDWSDEDRVRVMAPIYLALSQKKYTYEGDQRKEWIFSSLLDAAPTTVIMPWILGNLSGEKPMVWGGEEHLKYMQQQGGDVIDWYGMSRKMYDDMGLPVGMSRSFAMSTVVLPVLAEPDLLSVATAGGAKAARLGKLAGVGAGPVATMLRRTIGMSAVATRTAEELETMRDLARSVGEAADPKTAEELGEMVDALRRTAEEGHSESSAAALRMVMARVGSEISTRFYRHGTDLVEAMTTAQDAQVKAGLEGTSQVTLGRVLEGMEAGHGAKARAHAASAEVSLDMARQAAQNAVEFRKQASEYRRLLKALGVTDEALEADVDKLLKETDPKKVQEALQGNPELLSAVVLRTTDQGVDMAGKATVEAAKRATSKAKNPPKKTGAKKAPKKLKEESTPVELAQPSGIVDKGIEAYRGMKGAESSEKALRGSGRAMASGYKAEAKAQAKMGRSAGRAASKATRRAGEAGEVAKDAAATVNIFEVFADAVDEIAGDLRKGAEEVWKGKTAKAPEGPQASKFLRTELEDAQKTGAVQIDADAYRAHMKAVLGDEVLAMWSGQDVVRKALVGGKLSVDEFAELTKLEDGVLRLARAGEGGAFRNVMTAVEAGKPVSPGGFVRSFRKFIVGGSSADRVKAFAESQVRAMAWFRQRGVIASRGISAAASAQQHLNLRRSFERFHNIEHELELLRKRPGASKNPVDDLLRYLNSTEALDLGRHATSGNLGDLSLAARARQMATALLAQPAEEMAEAAKGAMYTAADSNELQALLTMWVPKNAEVQNFVARAAGALRTRLAAQPDLDLTVWAMGPLQQLTVELAGRASDAGEAVYFMSRGIAALANQADTLADMTKIPPVKDVQGFMNAVNFLQTTGKSDLQFTRTDLDQAEAAMREWGLAMSGNAPWKIEASPGITGFLNPMGEMKAVTQKLVTVGLGEGNGVVVPRRYLEMISEIPRNLSKEMMKANLDDKWFSSFVQNAMTMWRHSVIMGWGIPRFAHYAVTGVGDWAQTAASVSTYVATKHLIRNVIDMTPGISGLVDGLAKKHTPLLHALGAIDQDVRAVLTASDVHLIPTKEGFLKGKEVIQQATEDGVYDAMHALDKERLMQDIRATEIRGGGSKMWKDISAQIRTGGPLVEAASEGLAVAQLKNRMALYVELRKTMPRDEAAALMREALYDWSISMPDWKKSSILGASAFFNYTQNMYKQLGAFLTEDVTGAEGLFKVLSSQTKMGAALKQIRVVDVASQATASTMGTWQDPDTPIGRIARYSEALEARAPWYAKAKGLMFSLELSEDAQEYEERMSGKSRTHMAILAPAITTMDQIGNVLWAAQTAGWAHAKLVGGDNVDHISIEEALERGVEALASNFVPIVDDIVRTGATSVLSKATGREIEDRKPGGGAWKPSPGFIKILASLQGTALEGFIGQIHDGPLVRKGEHGYEWSSDSAAWVAMVITSLPQAMSILRASDTFINAEMQESYIRGMNLFIWRELGVFPTKLHDPATSMDFEGKAAQQALADSVTEGKTQGAIVPR